MNPNPSAGSVPVVRTSSEKTPEKTSGRVFGKVSGGRQPLLWAALAFAAGIFAGVHMWRPAVWWLVAAAAFIVFANYFKRRRGLVATPVALCALFAAGALAIQLRAVDNPDGSGLLQFAGGEEVVVTAHVTREGILSEATFGGTRQRLDLESELVSAGEKTVAVQSGLRVTFYGKEAKDENEAEAAGPPHLFRYGDRLRFTAKLYPPHNFRNPGAFDYRGYLADAGIVVLGSAKLADVELLPGFAGSRAELWRTRIHRSIIEKVHALWPPADAGLVDAMVIGEDAFLSRDTRVDFQRSGTYHVLVVSGMNVGILAFVTFGVLRRVRINDLAASTLTVVLSVGYAYLTDVGAPIWRATLMLTLYLGTRLVYRDRSMLNAIGAAALGLLIVDPRPLFGASFQLTFLCVLLIAAVGVPLLERTTQPFSKGLHHLDSVGYDVSLTPKIAQFRLDLRMIASRIERFFGKRISLPALSTGVGALFAACEVLVISAIMQVGLALPMAYYFHRATVVGLPANMLVVPLTGLMMPAAVLAVATGYISTTAAKAPALIASIALHGITGTVRWLGGLRIADTRVPTPAFAIVLLSVTALVLAMLLARRRSLLAAAGLAALAGSAFWICAVPPRPHFRTGVLEITAIDVGQGDSILLVSPEGHTLLVDAGGIPFWMHSEFDIGEDVVSSYLWSRGIDRLDAVAITHPHADHIGGMGAILANFRPREFWLGVDSPSPELKRLLQEAKDFNVPVVQHQEGDSFDLAGATIRVLAPERNAEIRTGRQNDESMVLKITYGNTSALLEGDAERREEETISEEQPQADLLKVAHHGSTTSTIPELLAAVHPRFAVISAGARNVYGHPRLEVLTRLAEAGVATYRTDLNGAVTFYLDGKTVSPSVADLP